MLESRNCRKHCVFPCEDGSVGLHLGEARGNPLQGARGESLDEEGGVAKVSEADRNALQTREDIWSKSGAFVIAGASCPQNNCMYRQSHNSNFLQHILTSCEEQKTSEDKLEESIIDDLRTLMNMELSQKVGSDPRDSASSTNDHHKVTHGHTTDIETTNDMARTVVIYVQM